MSWDRTLLALCVTSMMFVRWYPTEGLITLLPAALCGTAALTVHVTQRRRYAQQSAGIAVEQVRADVWAVLWTVGLVFVLTACALAAVWWL